MWSTEFAALGGLWGEHHLMFCDGEVMTYFSLAGSDEVFLNCLDY